MKPGLTNGRSGRVHDYLSRVKTARSPAEIRRAAEPTASLQAVCWTLAYMAQRGYLQKLGEGKGKVRFRIGTVVPGQQCSANGTPQLVRKSVPNRPVQATNFHAAPGTISSRPLNRLSASEQIAADIAAFESRGGRIQTLGTTQIFHTTNVGNDDED